MKNVFFISLLALTFVACATKQPMGSSAAVKDIESDSLSYEITILDTHFEQWYRLNFSPALDRENNFYQSKNRIGVINWNDFYVRGKHKQVIGSFIHYNPAEDYGIEVNRQLYWYFKYIENSYHISLFR